MVGRLHSPTRGGIGDYDRLMVRQHGTTWRFNAKKVITCLFLIGYNHATKRADSPSTAWQSVDFGDTCPTLSRFNKKEWS